LVTRNDESFDVDLLSQRVHGEIIAEASGK
jgi:hypothetical protein